MTIQRMVVGLSMELDEANWVGGQGVASLAGIAMGREVVVVEKAAVASQRGFEILGQATRVEGRETRPLII